MTKLKDFQDEPNMELADKLDHLAREAKELYGEYVLSEALSSQAYTYRTGTWQAVMKKIIDAMPEDENIEDPSIFEHIDFSKMKIQ